MTLYLLTRGNYINENLSYKMSLLGNTNKPTFVEQPITLTDTIVRQNQQGINDPTATQSSRAENAFGKSIDRGGQVLGIGFFNGIVNAYSNLVYVPLAVLLMVISSVYYVNEILKHTTDNIFTVMVKGALKSQGVDQGVIINAIITMTVGVLHFLAKYEPYVALTAAVWFPYFAKPSKRNGWTSAFLNFFGLFIVTQNLILLLLSHGYFLFTQLRAPMHKALILTFVITVCIFGQNFVGNLVGLSDIQTKYSGGGEPESPQIPGQPEPTSTTSTTTPKPPEPAVHPELPVGFQPIALRGARNVQRHADH